MKYEEATEVLINLTARAKWAARLALYRAGMLGWSEALRYPGPRFKQTADSTITSAIGHSTMNVVITPNDSSKAQVEYVYPLAQVGRIRITS